MPDEEWQAYVETLRNHFKQSEDIQAKEMLGFTKDLTVLNSRLERLKTAYLDGDFTRDEYLTEKQNIQREQEFIEKRIAELSTDNKEVVITLEYLLDLVSRVNSLYKSSRIDKKRRILNLVFSNFFLNGSNLSYELKRPFDLFIKRSNRLLNWAWRDSNSHALALVPKTSVSTIPPHAHIWLSKGLTTLSVSTPLANDT